ncbi:expressed unknown protein [Seminavis robusta]|uniref:Uncharacterized protein n=1 Tax=Seminavis robusta TaxID=568900 RepID=A0A9N8E6C4_9STRA|nr:expressed unknown protein [Seminavis robusta]|eukprot:Sro590_g171890.1 n/a (305) ;mRNA; r:39226-40140
MSSKKTPPKPDVETQEAIKTELKCGMMAGISALLDLVTYGFYLADWRSTMRTIWKITLAVNVFQAFQLFSDFHRKVEKDSLNSKLPFNYHMGKLFLRVMEIMTRVWRFTAIMVTLTSTSYVFMAWSDVIDHLRQGLLALVFVVFAYVAFRSDKESKAFSHVDPSQDSSALVPCIKKQGALLARTMALASTAFFLEVSLVPMVVAANLRTLSWGQLIVAFLQIPAPVAVGTNLITFRRQYMVLLGEISNRQKHLRGAGGNDVPWTPDSEKALARAAKDFYGEVIMAFQVDMVVKTIFILREMTTS